MSKLKKKKDDPILDMLIKMGFGPGRSNVPGATPRDRIKDYKGRSISLTPELMDVMCTLTQMGIPEKTILDCLALDKQTVKEWLRRADEGEPYRTFRLNWTAARVGDYLSGLQYDGVRDRVIAAKHIRQYVGDDRGPSTAVQVNVVNDAIDPAAIGKELVRRATIDERGEDDDEG